MNMIMGGLFSILLKIIDQFMSDSLGIKQIQIFKKVILNPS